MSPDNEPLVQPSETPVVQPSPPPERKGRLGRRKAAKDSGGSGDSRPSPENMLPEGRRRTAPERFFVRLIATAGVVGIGVAIGAIMVSSKSDGWMVGLVVSVVSVVLAAVLWSSRML